MVRDCKCSCHEFKEVMPGVYWPKGFHYEKCYCEMEVEPPKDFRDKFDMIFPFVQEIKDDTTKN